MITAVRSAEGTAIEVDAGATAFVDADWVRPAGALRGVLVPAKGAARWLDGAGGEVALDVPAGADAAATAVAALRGLAADIAATLDAHAPSATVEVVGDGALATLVRALGRPAPQAGEAPEAIVDLTGDPEVLLEATRRLPRLGLLVLAGPPTGEPLAFDLYPDVHARGLRVAGVGAPRAAAPAANGTVVPAPAPVAPGAALPSGAAWYVVG